MKVKKGHEIDELVVIKLYRSNYARDLMLSKIIKEFLEIFHLLFLNAMMDAAVVSTFVEPDGIRSFE